MTSSHIVPTFLVSAALAVVRAWLMDGALADATRSKACLAVWVEPEKWWWKDYNSVCESLNRWPRPWRGSLFLKIHHWWLQAHLAFFEVSSLFSLRLRPPLSGTKKENFSQHIPVNLCYRLYSPATLRLLQLAVHTTRWWHNNLYTRQGYCLTKCS